MSQLAALNPSAPEMPRLQLLVEGTTAWMRVPPDEVGTTRVRGVETTHYRANVDLDKALAEASARERAQTKTALEMFGGQKEMPVDVYIDDAGRVRRMELEYKLESEGNAFETKLKMELFDFGTRVAFKRPPASQVADLSSLTD
jgi:hypothetical protein